MASAQPLPESASPPHRQRVQEKPACPDGWLVRIPASALALDGFRTWAVSDHFPKRGRISFIDQEIVINMSPEAFGAHGKVRTEVARTIGNLNREKYLGEFFPDRTLVTNEAAGLSTEPDGTFATVQALQSGRARLVPLKDAPDDSKELQGSPDWVLEVISDSSERDDTGKLRQAYHRAGIAEYWMIDARGEEIDFQILYRGRDDYVAAPRRGGWQKSRVFGRSFQLTRRRNRIDLWDYLLQVK